MIRRPLSSFLFFYNDTATTEIYTLSLHDALPICKFGPETGWLAGRFVKAADADLVEDLRRRGLLWRGGTHTRTAEHTSELQSPPYIGCPLLFDKITTKTLMPLST